MNGDVLYWFANGAFHSAELLSRQQRYNSWAQRVREDGGALARFVAHADMHGDVPSKRIWDGDGLMLPERIPEHGQLNLQTIAIPYYRAAFDLVAIGDALARDCEALAASDRQLMPLCRSARRLTVSGFKEDTILRLDSRVQARAFLLQRALAVSEAYLRVLDRLFRSVPGGRRDRFETDGIAPYEISADRLEELEAADLELTSALVQARRAGDAR
jgi:hypothetical protein